jgi:CTP:phosphocholine cytidylyltransferase-like protein
MYTIKNAIILAAGIGSRLKPITENTPKALININGKPIVEYILDHLDTLELDNIVIVVGHLSNQFEYLTSKYSNLKLIENKLYNQANNISSLFEAKEFVESCVIIEGDLFLKNISIIKKSFKSTHYKAIKKVRSEDWSFHINSLGCVNEFKLGGENCFQMVGISYWNRHDSLKLKSLLSQEFEKKINQQLFWDEIPLVLHKDKFCVKLNLCKQNDVFEIDTIEDLCIHDQSYKNFTQNNKK